MKRRRKLNLADSIIKQVLKEQARERALFIALLESYKWNREKARKAIKMSRPSFFRKLKELELTKLTPKEWRKL